MSLIENIRKRSAELILNEVKENGICRVANPEACVKKVKKYTGVELDICDYMLKLKNNMKVIPFSNGSEAMSWMDDNCDICKNRSCYKRTSIQMGFITGKIPFKTAEFIGYDNLHGEFLDLNSKCNHFDDPVKKKPKAKKIDNNQKSLF